jgi:hypothetical protein
MWSDTQAEEIERARRSAPNRTLEEFLTLSAAISDTVRVSALEESSYDLLRPETRRLLRLKGTRDQ